MIDSIDGHGLFFVVDPVDDAIRPDAGASPACQLTFESVARSSWIGDQATEAELDDGPDDTR